MNKKLFLLTICTLSLSGCQTLDGMKSGFSGMGDWFSSSKTKDVSCPQFLVADELDTYYALPAAPQENVAYTKTQIDSIQGTCHTSNAVDVMSVDIQLDFTTTPASTETPAAAIPYFIAVLDQDQNILAKNTFQIPAEFSKPREIQTHTEQLQQNLPMPKGQNVNHYQIITGFQLSETQLTIARIHKAVPPTPVASSSLLTEDPNVDAIIGADPFAAGQ